MGLSVTHIADAHDLATKLLNYSFVDEATVKGLSDNELDIEFDSSKHPAHRAGVYPRELADIVSKSGWRVKDFDIDEHGFVSMSLRKRRQQVIIDE